MIADAKANSRTKGQVSGGNESSLKRSRLAPLTAAAWADAIVNFWRSADASSMIDRSQTLDIFDLWPGCGETAWLLMNALHRRLQVFPELAQRLRYLVVAPNRDTLNAIRAQKEFQLWIANESLVPVLWDPDRGEPCLLTPRKRFAWEATNPVVVLANDVWARLDQRLLAVHYGALLEADIGALANKQSDEEEAKLWFPAREQGLPAGLSPLLRECLLRFNSVPLPLPIGAIEMATRVTGLSKRGYLMLASADGTFTEQQMRLQTFPSLVERHRKGEAMPVNFYLLAKYFERLGAAAWQSEAAPGKVIQAVVGTLPRPHRILDPVQASLSNKNCGDAAALLKLARTATGWSRPPSESILALLRSTDFDPEVFVECTGAIMEILKPDTTVDRAPWREALQQIWQRHLPLPGTRPLHRMLAPALMRAGSWGYARSVLQRGLQIHGNDALDFAHLAWCEFRTGRLVEARKWIHRALSMPEKHATVTEVAEKIEDKLQRLHGGWLQTVPSSRMPVICLEPLDMLHAEALHQQYRDPQIAIMTGLPALTTLDATREWVNGHSTDSGRRAYAVMHVDHGFLGYACMAVSGTIAYFCFWIGADYQGLGFAAEIARLTCELGIRQGMTHIYTSAYADNARSLRSLERSGFTRLPIRALPPDHDRIFLFLQGAGAPVLDPEADLIAYYRDEKLPLKFPDRIAVVGRAHSGCHEHAQQNDAARA
ncbi:GNAT family N-acetyltransferase [Noviherbaspirillum pedocola]|uniref:GNAT family N-acetyltransferase n=1 Tax=Noviherbaspirillum pedocola TaxID=2801341 RepID=A0A934W3V4_9BURK|nr:GNAT family N-acetyltransferase [Noviherbaspirillum pedocola]MBK4733242.1 GNAT family N-acetyltransferase [Noviherbaspirillum pedocola]